MGEETSELGTMGGAEQSPKMSVSVVDMRSLQPLEGELGGVTGAHWKRPPAQGAPGWEGAGTEAEAEA